MENRAIISKIEFKNINLSIFPPIPSFCENRAEKLSGCMCETDERKVTFIN